jgi:hypothetical protein
VGRKAIDLTGQVFSNLKVITRAGYHETYRTIWLCRCLLCKRGVKVRSYGLRSGQNTSCGCDRIKRLREAATTHGKTKTPEYATWRQMLYRCRTPTSANYDDYGGRGIDFDPRWESFEVFLRDMGRRPSARHSLDRRDNDLGYWPDNCRWTTAKKQLRNRRDNLYLTVNGVTRLVVEWAEITGLSQWTIKSRMRRKCPPEQCVEKKHGDGNQHFLGRWRSTNSRRCADG